MPGGGIRKAPRRASAFATRTNKENDDIATVFSGVWQLPFVNVFKQGNIFTGKKNHVIAGDVKQGMDSEIGKRVFRLRGAVSAANTLDLPSPKPDAKPLGLKGNYIYAQCRAVPTRPFCLHIDVITQQNLGLRISLSNIYKTVKMTGRTVQVPCSLDKGQRTKAKWTVLCLHIPSLLHDYFHPSMVYKMIKSFRICSNLDVRNIFTSNTRYALDTLPRDMTFPVPRAQTWQQRYVWLEVQPYPDGASIPAGTVLPDTDTDTDAHAHNHAHNQIHTHTHTHNHTHTAAASTTELKPKLKAKLGVGARAGARAKAAAAREASSLPSPAGAGAMLSPASVQIVRHMAPVTPAQAQATPDCADLSCLTTPSSSSSSCCDDSVSATSCSDDATSPTRRHPSVRDRCLNTPFQSPAFEDQLLSLERAIGYSTRVASKHICWLPTDRHIVYSNNNLVMLLDVHTGAQQFLFGHTAPISCMCFSKVSRAPYLATAQEGDHPMVKIFDFGDWCEANMDPASRPARLDGDVHISCVAELSADFHSNICSLDFTGEHGYRKGKLLLAAVAKDRRKRSVAAVWDLSEVSPARPPPLVAHQTSEFDIQKLLFSPYAADPFNLVSCGQHSVRFWRIKNRHLPAHSLVLNSYSRTVFTDMGFEPMYGVADAQQKRLFVATSEGAVFQVNYHDRRLECIYQLHSAAITTISINEGFCVTGSEDCFLRVYPLDFTDYYLQAKHKGAVGCVQVSQDGLQIVAGTAQGTIGILDVASTVYRTRVRSHANNNVIHGVAMDPQRSEFTTVSADGTIRVWSLDHMEQVYEFYSKDPALCVAYHPDSSQYKIACGFASGAMRVMDIPSVTMHIDYHQHRGSVLDIAFDKEGKWLYTSGLDGNICQYAVGNDYQPFRMFASYRTPPAPLPTRATLCPACSFKPKSTRTLSSRGRSPPPSVSFGLATPSKTSAFSSSASASASSSPSPSASSASASSSSSSASSSSSLSPATSAAAAAAALEDAPEHTCAKYCPDQMYPHCLDVNDSGELLATLGTHPMVVIIVSTKTMSEVTQIKASGLEPLAKFHFSVARDSEIVLVTRDASFQRRCLQTGQLVGSSCTKAPKHLLSKSRPNFDRAGNVKQEPPEGSTTATTLSPKGRFLVSAKSDGVMQVWEYFSEPDPRTGVTQSQRYKMHFDISKLARKSWTGATCTSNTSVSQMVFSRKGDWLVSVGGDSIFTWRFSGQDTVPSAWEGAHSVYEQQRQEATRMVHHAQSVAREVFVDRDEGAAKLQGRHGPGEWLPGCGHHHWIQPDLDGSPRSDASSPYPTMNEHPAYDPHGMSPLSSPDLGEADDGSSEGDCVEVEGDLEVEGKVDVESVALSTEDVASEDDAIETLD